MKQDTAASPLDRLPLNTYAISLYAFEAAGTNVELLLTSGKGAISLSGPPAMPAAWTEK